MCRTSGESSTRWKSSNTSAEGSPGTPPSSRRNVSSTVSSGGADVAVSRSRPLVAAPKSGTWIADRRDEVGEEADPVAVAAIEPKPQHPDAGPPGEVGEQGRLAVAGLGDEEHDPPMDLDRQPLEEAVAGERLVAQRRRLDLADLDRVLGHLAEVPSGAAGSEARAGRTPSTTSEGAVAGREDPVLDRSAARAALELVAQGRRLRRVRRPI